MFYITLNGTWSQIFSLALSEKVQFDPDSKSKTSSSFMLSFVWYLEENDMPLRVDLLVWHGVIFTKYVKTIKGKTTSVTLILLKAQLQCFFILNLHEFWVAAAGHLTLSLSQTIIFSTNNANKAFNNSIKKHILKW